MFDTGGAKLQNVLAVKNWLKVHQILEKMFNHTAPLTRPTTTLKPTCGPFN